MGNVSRFIWSLLTKTIFCRRTLIQPIRLPPSGISATPKSNQPTPSTIESTPLGMRVAARAPALLLVRLLILVVILRVTQFILVIDFKFLGSLGLIVELSNRRLIFTRVLIVAVVVIILGTTRGMGGESFGIHGNH